MEEIQQQRRSFIFDFGGRTNEPLKDLRYDENGNKYLYPVNPKTGKAYLFHKDGRLVIGGE